MFEAEARGGVTIDSTAIDFGGRARRLRLDTLVRLRWFAIAGQLAAVLLVRFVAGFSLPLGLCLGVIAASACLNLGLRLVFPRGSRLSDGPAAAMQGFDIVQLVALLSLTGGIENPFAVLALAPVMISAVSLPRRMTAMLLALMMAASLVIVHVRLPLPWVEGGAFSLPLLYRYGLWIALCLSGGFVCLYAGRVAEEARRLGDALAATEFALVREQHLTQLDGLAAAAAHELGTPLATITLIAKEMLRHPDRPASKEDLDILTQQTARCRGILGTLTSLGSDGDGMFDVMSLGLLIEEAIAPHRNFGVGVRADLAGQGPEPHCRRSPGMLYGLGNLIENAVDFASAEVHVRASWTEATVSILIEDDGPGFPPDVLGQAGEPYVTSRRDARKNKVEEGSGLGLGLFIAKSLLERSGAKLTLENAPAPGRGARDRLKWPRAAFEQDAAKPARAA